MATYTPAKRATAFRLYLSLVSQANTKLMQVNPTMAAGDVQVSKDGGAFANITTLPSAVPAGGRSLQVDLSATEMTADNVLIQFVDAAGAEWCDLTFNIPTALLQFNDLATPTNITAGTVTTATNVTTVNGLAASVITAASIASAALAAAKFAADTGLLPVRSATAQAGAATTITLDASASAVDNFYLNDLIYIVGGTGIGQARFISGYVGATKVATVGTWATNPDNTSVFAIIPSDSGSFALPTNFSLLSIDGSGRVDVGKVTGTAQTARDLGAQMDAAISTRMATYTQPTGFLAATFPSGTVANTTNITAGTITTVTNLTNAATAGDFTAVMKTSIGTAVAASAVASVTARVTANTDQLAGQTVTAAAGVTFPASVASPTNITGGTITTTTNLTNAPTVGDLTAAMKASIATAVWTDLLASSDFSTASSVGALLKSDIDSDLAALATALNSVLSLLNDPRGEPTQGAPPVNPNAMTKMDYLYKSWRNLKTNDGTTTILYANNGTTVDHKQATSQAAGTVTKAKWVTGP